MGLNHTKVPEDFILDGRIQWLTLVGILQKETGLPITKIAKRSNIKLKRLTRILDGIADTTIMEVADIGYALGVRWGFELKSLEGIDA